MENVDWEDIRVFLAVADSVSIAKAADLLGMTQPTVSRKVAHLESKVGDALFDRSPSGTTLTKTGKALVSSARKMSKSASEFQQLSTHSASGEAGTVRLNAPDGLAYMLLVPKLRDFHRDHPQMSMNINAGLTHDDDSTPDISLQFLDPQDGDLIRAPVCWVHYSYFAAPSYIEEFGSPTNLAELLGHRIIQHTSYLNHQKAWAEKTGAVGTLVDEKLTFVSNSSAVNIQAARNGLGIATLPTVAAELFSDLTPLPLGKAATARLAMYYSPNLKASEKLKICCDWLSSILSANQPWFQEEYVDPCDATSVAA